VSAGAVDETAAPDRHRNNVSLLYQSFRTFWRQQCPIQSS
jgi:hypothetical protein